MKNKNKSQNGVGVEGHIRRRGLACWGFAQSERRHQALSLLPPSFLCSVSSAGPDTGAQVHASSSSCWLVALLLCSPVSSSENGIVPTSEGWVRIQEGGVWPRFRVLPGTGTFPGGGGVGTLQNSGAGAFTTYHTPSHSPPSPDFTSTCQGHSNSGHGRRDGYLMVTESENSPKIFDSLIFISVKFHGRLMCWYMFSCFAPRWASGPSVLEQVSWHQPSTSNTKVNHGPQESPVLGT